MGLVATFRVDPFVQVALVKVPTYTVVEGMLPAWMRMMSRLWRFWSSSARGWQNQGLLENHGANTPLVVGKIYLWLSPTIQIPQGTPHSMALNMEPRNPELFLLRNGSETMSGVSFLNRRLFRARNCRLNGVWWTGPSLHLLKLLNGALLFCQSSGNMNSALRQSSQRSLMSKKSFL